jgi:hypothetical protein
MKKLLSFLVLCLSVSAQAPTFFRINLIWNNNVETDLAGYRMYQSVPPSTNWTFVGSSVTNVITVTNTITALQKFRVTALNTAGLESLPSNECSVNTVAPNSPGMLRLQSVTVTLVP